MAFSRLQDPAQTLRFFPGEVKNNTIDIFPYYPHTRETRWAGRHAEGG